MTRWRSFGSPDIGDIWYSHWSGEKAEDAGHAMLDVVRALEEPFALNLVLANLYERVKAIDLG